MESKLHKVLCEMYDICLIEKIFFSSATIIVHHKTTETEELLQIDRIKMLLQSSFYEV